jgi:carbon-monoxide dehydrogenase small subunit
MKEQIRLRVNGQFHDLLVEPHRMLLEVLRDDLGLTGTKWSCLAGECGACAVLIDGKSTISCLTLAVSVQHVEITTIEGLAKGNKLHPIQQAFVDNGAIQCGFCTPGMILSAKALLDENPDPTKEEVKSGLAGNLCRCTGYIKIIEAVLAAAQTIRKKEEYNR